MVDNSKKNDFVKGENENSVDLLIRRFKAGDPEVMYEKIQSTVELAVDSLDGDPRIATYSISRLPPPHWSVEERLKPLNPFYQDKTKKKKFIPTIETEAEDTKLNRQTSSERAAAEAKSLRATRAALKAAEKQIVLSAIKKNSSEKAFRKHSANMPVSYNGFIAEKSKAYA